MTVRAAEALRKDVRHAYRECGRATGAVQQSLLSDGVSQGLDIGSSHGESPIRNCRGRSGGGLANNPCRTIYRKVNTRLKHRGRDDRHDGNGRLGHHGAVADHTRLRSHAR